jgi:acyl-CoA thioesterase FadM
MKIDYEVYNSEKNLLVTGYTVHSFINSNGNAVRPPKVFIEKLRG